MGIFEPLIEHSDDKPPKPQPFRDVVAPILFVLLAMWLLAVVLLLGAAKTKLTRDTTAT